MDSEQLKAEYMERKEHLQTLINKSDNPEQRDKLNALIDLERYRYTRKAFALLGY